MTQSDKMQEIEKKLQAEFAPNEIEWRVGRAGKTKTGEVWAKVLAYVDARAIQRRLDEVVGPMFWEVHYQAITLGEYNGWLADIEITVIDLKDNARHRASKQDGADLTDIESFKGGISKAFVRAASAWGIGRYLYTWEETWAQTTTEKPRDDGWNFVGASPKNDMPAFWWKAPETKAPKPQTARVDAERKEAPALPLPSKELLTQIQQAQAIEPIPTPTIKGLTLRMNQKKWTPDQVGKYAQARFGRAARDCNAEQLAVIIADMALPFDQAMATWTAQRAAQEAKAKTEWDQHQQTTLL